MENQVSIIINGVRYDAVEGMYCSECAFYDTCSFHWVNLCDVLGVSDKIFNKSDKKFEV